MRTKRVVLVGLGKFGWEYYQELNRLETERKITLVCVCTQTGETKRNINHSLIRVYDLNADLIETIDAIIVASSAKSHHELVGKFYRYCDILVEKPAATLVAQMQNYIDMSSHGSKRIVPAQIFRHNPAVQFVKELIEGERHSVTSVSSSFVNRQESKIVDDVALEMLHPVDITQFLVSKSPISSVRFDTGNVANISCEYDEFIANHELGFSDKKIRKYSICLESLEIEIDFLENSVFIKDLKKDTLLKKFFDDEKNDLRNMLLSFLDGSINNELFPTLIDSKETLSAVISSPLVERRRMKIAIIGGGIFGSQCAIALSELGHVDLFEKNSDLMIEASYKNQWRHHSGFHYPLSFETVREINECKYLFEEQYAKSIISSVPSYYMVSSSAKEIPVERYLSACDLHKLNYSIVPTLDCVESRSVSVTLLTDEGLYDMHILNELVHDKLYSSGVNVFLNSKVTNGYLKAGKKILEFEREGTINHEEYDVVINCSYSNFGEMSSLFKIPKKKSRLELVEMLELELDLDPICLTFIDAPFMSLTSMLKPKRFFLTHRDHSVMCRTFTESRDDIGSKLALESNRRNLINSASMYMPFISNAKVIKSWHSYKARSAYENEFWETPTVVKEHGFGYWSVLGGKVLTCVKNAADIRDRVKAYL